MSNTKIRVMIVDDHAGVRAGIRNLLQAAGDIVVVGEAGDGEEALELAKTHLPDIVLLDVELPVMRGDVVARRMHELQPEIKVLAVSSYNDQTYIHSMLENGAAGYITKEEAPDLLLPAIRSVHKKGRRNWLSPAAMRNTALPRVGEPVLTTREVEILEQLLMDRTDREIAAHLGMDENQVQRHLSLLEEKFETSSREALKRNARNILPGPPEL